MDNLSDRMCVSMKLLHCMACHEIRSLSREWKACGCGAAKGRYVGDVLVEFSGPARILGMRNPDILRARANEGGGLSENYPWWVIPLVSGRIKKVEG